MKGPSFLTMPWDLVVFLTITTTGLGFSVQRLRTTNSADRMSIQATEAREASLADRLVSGGPLYLDLGCVERRIGKERVSGQQGAVRVKGRFCNLSRTAMRSFGGANVRNLTNGRSGTLFFRGEDSEFISDALPLVRGKNTIVVEWKDDRSANAREFVTEVFED